MSYRRSEEGCFQVILGGFLLIMISSLFGHWINSLLIDFGYKFTSKWISFAVGAIILVALLLLLINFNSILSKILSALDFYFNRANIRKLEDEYEYELKIQRIKLDKLLNDRP
jgi:uncharacterized membrane protein